MLFRRRIVPALTLTACLALAPACAPFATYPPIDGAVGIDNPAYEPIPTLIANAFSGIHDRYGAGHDTFAINLPPGTEAKVYERVLAKLPAAEPMTSSGRWGYHLVELRSRGLSAEADIIIPRQAGPHAMVTLHLQRNLDNYSVQAAKLWNLPVEVPGPNYVPEVDEAIAHGEAE